MFVFCNVWLCVCMGFAMCGCFDNYVCVLVICVLVFTVFFYCFDYLHVFLFVTSVRTSATE
jgi:hypothetical protein